MDYQPVSNKAMKDIHWGSGARERIFPSTRKDHRSPIQPVTSHPHPSQHATFLLPTAYVNDGGFGSTSVHDGQQTKQKYDMEGKPKPIPVGRSGYAVTVLGLNHPSSQN